MSLSAAVCVSSVRSYGGQSSHQALLSKGGQRVQLRVRQVQTLNRQVAGSKETLKAESSFNECDFCSLARVCDFTFVCLFSICMLWHVCFTAFCTADWSCFPAALASSKSVCLVFGLCRVLSRTTSRYYVYIMGEEGKIYIRKIYVPKENVSFTYFKNVQFHISCTCIEGLEHYQTFIRHTAISNNFTTVNIM